MCLLISGSKVRILAHPPSTFRKPTVLGCCADHRGQIRSCQSHHRPSNRSMAGPFQPDPALAVSDDPTRRPRNRPKPVIDMETANLLVRALDLIGTFVFAISGAMLGIRQGMDLFGVVVLAHGGIWRHPARPLDRRGS